MSAPSFDPTKAYTWEPSTKFVITGQELNLFVHLLRGMLSTQEASNIILAYEANKSIEALLDTYIKMGSVREATDDIEVIQPEVITPETII